ncbi:MAG: hypothetical protein ABIQ58_02615, partial [Candidatus Limnocylindrales bacterium]
MTEEQQGGTPPDTEAIASDPAQAIEMNDGAVAVAEEPVESTAATDPVTGEVEPEPRSPEAVAEASPETVEPVEATAALDAEDAPVEPATAAEGPVVAVDASVE